MGCGLCRGKPAGGTKSTQKSSDKRVISNDRWMEGERGAVALGALLHTVHVPLNGEQHGGLLVQGSMNPCHESHRALVTAFYAQDGNVSPSPVCSEVARLTYWALSDGRVAPADERTRTKFDAFRRLGYSARLNRQTLQLSNARSRNRSWLSIQTSAVYRHARATVRRLAGLP